MPGAVGGAVRSPMTYNESPSRGNKTRFISPDEVMQNFFYDDGVIRSLNKHGVDVAKGHLALLEASASDEFLQISVLLEGRTIEFLYGPHGLARAMAALSSRSLSAHSAITAVRVIMASNWSTPRASSSRATMARWPMTSQCAPVMLATAVAARGTRPPPHTQAARS